MAVDTAAGSKISIGPVNASAATPTDYQALSYVEVGEVENIGEFGDSFNEVNFTALSDRRVRKFKGSRNAGNIQLTIGHDSANTGQTNLNAALETDFDYAFRVELDDAGSGTGAAPTTFYFRAKVMAAPITPGDTETIVRINATLGINSDILKIDAV